MLDIKYLENFDNQIDNIISKEFNKFASKNDIICDYKPFYFIAKEEEKVIGVLAGYSYYNEVCISDLIVLEEYRNKKVGSKLIKSIEQHYKDKGFEYISVTSHDFQAPEFYKKCGFELESIRKSKKDSKLDKYFLAKYF